MKTRLQTTAAQLRKHADKLIAEGETAEAMGEALYDAKYLIEGLHGDFIKQCINKRSGELCGRDECDEVGCIFEKYCRIKAALKRA